MRLGRVLLALLAPLVSLPSLKTDLAAAGAAASADSLKGLLRAVVPLASVSAAESHPAVGSHAPRALSPVFEFLTVARCAAGSTPATDARLRLLARKRQRVLLRC